MKQQYRQWSTTLLSVVLCVTAIIVIAFAMHCDQQAEWETVPARARLEPIPDPQTNVRITIDPNDLRELTPDEVEQRKREAE